jgi:hypothetical protein
VVLRDANDQTPLSENWRGNRTPNHLFLSRGSITARLVLGCLMFTLIRTRMASLGLRSAPSTWRAMSGGKTWAGCSQSCLINAKDNLLTRRIGAQRSVSDPDTADAR